jgi:hypothetical protein
MGLPALAAVHIPAGCPVNAAALRWQTAPEGKFLREAGLDEKQPRPNGLVCPVLPSGQLAAPGR